MNKKMVNNPKRKMSNDYEWAIYRKREINIK